MVACNNFTLKDYESNARVVKIAPDSVILINGRLPVGVDLAARLFQVCYQAPDGSMVNRELRREEFEHMILSSEVPLYLGMEGCSGCSYWADFMRMHGHEARIMNAARIAGRRGPHSDKDDRIDAELIRLALLDDEISCRPRTQEELSIKKAFQLMDSTRQKVNRDVNGVRAMLIDKGEGSLRVRTADDALWAIACYRKKHQLTLLDESLLERYEESILGNCAQMDKILHSIIEPFACENPLALLLMSEAGFGVQTAALFAADVGDISRFKDARALQAYLGLVPSHTGSGGKIRMGRMKHAGDHILKRYLYEAALSLCHQGKGFKQAVNGPRSEWIAKTMSRHEGAFKRGVLCVAAKLARVAYGMLMHQSRYHPETDDALGKAKQRPSKAHTSSLKRTWRGEMSYVDFSQYRRLSNPHNPLATSSSLADHGINPGFEDNRDRTLMFEALNRSVRISEHNRLRA